MARTIAQIFGVGGWKSRTQRRIDQNLGVIPFPLNESGEYRNPLLDLYDAYYEGRQYDHLQPWENACDCNGDYVPIRKRKPRIQYAYAKVLAQRIAGKLVGDTVFPALKIADDPDTEEFLKYVMKAAKFQSRILEPIRLELISGSVFVRFYLIEGVLKMEHFHSKHCYPVFDVTGELESIEIKYVYDDPEEKDTKGCPLRKWYKLQLSKTTDTLFDNPVFEANAQPEFTPVTSVQHDMGFVQGQWMRTCEDKHSPDGYSLICDILDFIDEINYSISQSSQAVAYNQDPQLTLTKMSEEDVGRLIKSATKAWNLGREGQAQFLEAGLGGVERAIELRDKFKLSIQDISRVIMLDPEKIVGQAQSGRALEIMHGPMVELIKELRPQTEADLIALVTKMGLAILKANEQGIPVPVVIPPGYQPQSFNIEADWPPVFAMTMEDLKSKVTVATQLTSGNIFSREWATGWLAKDFGVMDVELEQQKIAAQPVINPFGGF